MSVLIKGMELPKNCWECSPLELNVGITMFGGICPFCVKIVTDYDMSTGRHPDCPLIEVPTPHGDLIDRWELTETAMIDPDEGKYVAVYRADEVDEAPVIIEAEGRE